MTPPTIRPDFPDHLVNLFRNLTLNNPPAAGLADLSAGIFDHLPICVYTCIYDGQKLLIKSVSRGLSRLLGYAREDLVDKKNFRELTVDDIPYQRIAVRHNQPCKEFACIQMYYTADREIKLLIDRGFFFYGPDGDLQGTAGMLMDFGLDPGLDVYEYNNPQYHRSGVDEDSPTANLCGNIASQSIIMKSVFERIIKLSASSANVVIHGESGTGKELVARAIHDLSSRRKHNFVAVNCGAIPENLIESELFGYRKGAFTGAVADTPGFLDTADKGTLFLDEVGEMPLNMQVKFLRVLDGYGHVPVGGNKARFYDFRLLCATHRNLSELVEAGLIRRDFFYRLKGVDIRLPPLRERREDIPVLIDFFVAKYYQSQPGAGDRDKAMVPEEVKTKFMNYDWPGNVRELQHAVISYMSLKELNLPEADLAAAPTESPSNNDRPQAQAGRDAYERDKLSRVLEEHDWDKDATAWALGISKRTLYRRLAKFHLK